MPLRYTKKPEWNQAKPAESHGISKTTLKCDSDAIRDLKYHKNIVIKWTITLFCFANLFQTIKWNFISMENSILLITTRWLFIVFQRNYSLKFMKFFLATSDRGRSVGEKRLKLKNDSNSKMRLARSAITFAKGENG